MDIMEGSILHHIAFVLLLLCDLVQLGYARPVVFLVSLLYLHAVNGRYNLRLQKRLQFERKHANQRRLLSDTESVRWLNHAIEKIWPICMEKIASQQFLLPIIPWFLDKFKPWTAKKAVMQHFYLGRTPPMFTDIRILQESADEDHMVLELGMNFLSADDMSAKLAVQLRKRLGFGITTMMHITGMQVEGKVTSPAGNTVHSLKGKSGDKFEFKAPRAGMYKFCFHNPNRTPETVSFYIHVGHIPNEHDIAKDEHLNPINVKIALLREALESVTAEQRYLKAREVRHRHTNESTRRRLTYYTIMEYVVLALASGLQVVYIRRLFNKSVGYNRV